MEDGHQETTVFVRLKSGQWQRLGEAKECRPHTFILTQLDLPQVSHPQLCTWDHTLG